MQLRLRALRDQRGLKIDDVADETGLTAATISRIERGAQNTTLETLQRLAACYGVDVPELFEYQGRNPLMRLAWSVDPDHADLVAEFLEVYLRRFGSEPQH